MKFTKVGLKSAGSVRSLVVNDLSPGLNLVFGETGAGKSTLRRGVGHLLYGSLLTEVGAEWAGSEAAGELDVSVEGAPYCFRRTAGAATPPADALESPLGAPPRSLKRQLGDLSATDYATFFNLSFVSAPDIERRMVRRLVERFGVTRGGSPWKSEAEYHHWRTEATHRREQLGLDTTHWQRLIGRRERLETELADTETQHRSRMVDLEKRRDRARAELTTLERERAELAQRLHELDLELRQRESLADRLPLVPASGAEEVADLRPLQQAYRRLDRLQGEIRRTLAVLRDLQRRRQSLAELRGRLVESDDCPDDWEFRDVRRRMARWERHWQNWAGSRGDEGPWEPLADWTAAEFYSPSRAGDEVSSPHWNWPVDSELVPLEAEELRGRTGSRWDDALPAWQGQRAEWESLKAAVGRLAKANRRAQWLAEDRDLRRCQAELRRRLQWLERRKSARLTQIQRWDSAGHELLRHGEQRFLDYARQHGYWAARCHFVGPVASAPTRVEPAPLPPLPDESLRQLQAERRRLQARLGELDHAVGETRSQVGALAEQYQRLRDGLNVDALRRELQDVQSELATREPALRRLREAVQRDEPLWNLKYDGLLDSASQWCRQLTGGRLAKIALDRQDLRLLAGDSTGAEKPFHSLPREQQDLVCLSVCLAVAGKMADQGTPVPLVLDDLFANLDVQRSQTVVDTLWDFVGQGHQVVVLAAERQISQRWLSRPLSPAEQARLAVYQLPSAVAVQQRTQWPLVLNPLHLSSATAVREIDEPSPTPGRWPLITEQTPLAHLDLIEPEWLLVFSKHRILLVGDLLDLVPEDLPPALRTHGLTMGQIERWQSQAWLLCCIPGLRPYDVRLLVGSGITEPEQLEDLSASDVLRKLEIYLATEEGQRVMQTGTDDEQARLHGWMNGLRDNRQTWGTRRASVAGGTRRQRWQAARRSRRPEPALTMRIHESPSPRGSNESAATDRLTFYLNLGDPLERAPSIGPRMAERFAEIGIATVQDFLAAQPEDMVRKLKLRRLDQRTLRDWQHQARLVCRIPNLRGHDAQLLVACEIDDPEALLRLSAKELFDKVAPFAQSKEGQRILRSSPPPDLAEVQDWLAWAQHHRSLQVA